jgi:hypothetical protein
MSLSGTDAIVIMLSLFRSKEFKLVSKILENNNFLAKEFRKFRVDETTVILLDKNLVHFLSEVITSLKLDHSRLIKSAILTLRILQLAPKMQENS